MLKTRARTVQARIAGAAMLFAFAGTSALAADYPVLAAPSPPPSDLAVPAIGYGWATAINGEVGVRNLPPVDANVDFPDVLRRLDGVVHGLVPGEERRVDGR